MDHKDLDVWKASVELAVQLYEVTKQFPKEEVYGLTSQMRRAIVSVSSNIAEGAARNSDKEFIQYLYIALGSLAETETQFIIAEKLGYTKEAGNLADKMVSVRQMVLGLVKYLKKKNVKGKAVKRDA
jgi:four helix bundle protein